MARSQIVIGRMPEAEETKLLGRRRFYLEDPFECDVLAVAGIRENCRVVRPNRFDRG